MRTRSILLAGLAAVACARATTLQQLSLDDMIQQSTGIVRAKVTGSRARCAARTFTPITTCRFWRRRRPAGGEAAGRLDVAVPGGTVNGMRQVAIGRPELTTGSRIRCVPVDQPVRIDADYRAFAGLVPGGREDARARSSLARPAADDLMLDRNGSRSQARALGLAVERTAGAHSARSWAPEVSRMGTARRLLMLAASLAAVSSVASGYAHWVFFPAAALPSLPFRRCSIWPA